MADNINLILASNGKIRERTDDVRFAGTGSLIILEQIGRDLLERVKRASTGKVSEDMTSSEVKPSCFVKDFMKDLQ